MKTALILVLASGVLAAQGTAVSKSVNDGVFTTTQAERGQKVFGGTCTACHDTGRFTGSDFLKSWSGQPLNALFDLVKTTMPEDNPGSLQEQEYADVIAYLLSLNKYPSGQDELQGTNEAMKAILMELKRP